MKKFTLILSLVLILALSSVTAFADEIVINIDSVKVDFNDVLGFPFIDENNRTQVPFRATLEKYGAEVDWNNESRTAIATKGDVTVELPIGENYIIKNGEKITIDTAARIVNDRTFLPIRPVIEAFDSSVEWDGAVNTVVITTEPVDAKAIYMEASNKSYEWKNYDIKGLINVAMDIPDDTGSVQTMKMNMNMDMIAFMDPLKFKMDFTMDVPLMGTETMTMLMKMYMTADDEGYTTYVGTNETGEFKWVKQTVAAEMLADLMKYDEETIQKNKELTEKYTKDVKYFGKYSEEGKSLLKLQYTLSGDIYKEMFGEFSDSMPEPTNEQEAMTIEMMENLANANMGDLTFIVYVDEATDEMVRIEMDLGTMIESMVGGMAEIFGELPQEALDVLSSLKATMVMDFLNFNEAEDFEIPEEALNAPDMAEMLEELEQLEIEAEEEL